MGHRVELGVSSVKVDGHELRAVAVEASLSPHEPPMVKISMVGAPIVINDAVIIDDTALRLGRAATDFFNRLAEAGKGHTTYDVAMAERERLREALEAFERLYENRF